ncbi:nitroreductase family protein [Aureimonas jatrophae]|uniref:nitroreductase family protein n=1 Tax=Aureimonas jatrophae TaxID=1166073 RepID=UPI00185CDFCF|nr:nitroreductase [Aureimonas jatrophae]MBB3951322.1 nitroreductase [Aureimonas jatrophae]
MIDAQTLLSTRRSVPIPALRAPAPEGAELDDILVEAMRVPDHGKLAPWRFILFRGDGARKMGQKLADVAERREGTLGEGRRAYEETRFTRAPLVVGVVSTAKPHFKIPEWEQVLSVGAATMNLIHAAHARGYGANWITEWVAYDDDAKAIMGIKADEKVAGFVYIGTVSERPSDRPRPAITDHVVEAGAA